jgi:hypothetical protein
MAGAGGARVEADPLKDADGLAITFAEPSPTERRGSG